MLICLAQLCIVVVLCKVILYILLNSEKPFGCFVVVFYLHWLFALEHSVMVKNVFPRTKINVI